MSGERESAIIQEMVDAGEVIPLRENYFEDMGGHLITEKDVLAYYPHYLKNLSPEERAEVESRIGSIE